MEKLINMSAKFRSLLFRQEGQDLVEYALVIALISLGSIAAMSTLATDVSSFFISTGTTLSSAVD